MIIVIDGKRLDTDKAKAEFDLGYHDGRNSHCGTLYLSSAGTWYVWTPSQWRTGIAGSCATRSRRSSTMGAGSTTTTDARSCVSLARRPSSDSGASAGAHGSDARPGSQPRYQRSK